MPFMKHKIGWLILLICYAIILMHAIPRDILLEKQYCGDLRGRVVGARLIKDGKSPYFYKWKKEDSTRYYDPANFTTFKVSNLTGTPFLHHLLFPLAELPERRISLIWLTFEYFIFFGMVALALLYCNTDRQRQAVLIFSCLFLLT
jgi:hypothetical protein